MARNSPTIIVTGAAGFVGRRLVKKLSRAYPPKNILCLIKEINEAKDQKGIKVIKKLGLKTKKADLVSGKGLGNLPKKPQLIIHLAAETDTSKSDHRVNDVGVKNLYHFKRKN